MNGTKRISRSMLAVIVATCFLVALWPSLDDVPQDSRLHSLCPDGPNGRCSLPEAPPARSTVTRLQSSSGHDMDAREQRVADYVAKKSTTEFNGVCPMLYPANHSLVNTGRKALVLYTMTSVTDIYDRQVEIDNFLFFRAHAMMPPNTPTALFSSVDYIIMTSDLSRKANATATGRTVAQCSENENVRVLEGPTAPCDLCVQARVINAMGGPAAFAREYEFIALINSGTRGPFFTEAPAMRSGPPPVTWIDHFALGGEKVYTGTTFVGVVGTGKRPYMTSFAFGFPGSLVMAIHPVLSAGCSDAPLPKLFTEYAISFDAELHRMDDTSTPGLLKTLEYIRDHPESVKSTPRGPRNAAARKVDEIIAEGARTHHQRAIEAIAAIKKGPAGPPWSEWKMKCVYRTEVQNMNTALRTKLPPEMGETSSTHPSWLRRPKLTAEQRSQLSPVLTGYLHEGHYFAHSLHHGETIATMGHGLVFQNPGTPCNMCGSLLGKYGGMAWRTKNMGGCAVEVQKASMAQQPRRLPPIINVGEILRCPNRGPVKPLWHR